MRVLLGELALGASVLVLLVAWAVLLPPVLLVGSLMGFDGQVVLAAHSVAFFVAFWALGPWFLFGRGGEADDGPD